VKHFAQALNLKKRKTAAGEVEIKSACELSGPSARHLSQFLWHGVTRSISTTLYPLDRMLVHRRITPNIKFFKQYFRRWWTDIVISVAELTLDIGE